LVNLLPLSIKCKNTLKYLSKLVIIPVPSGTFIGATNGSVSDGKSAKNKFNTSVSLFDCVKPVKEWLNFSVIFKFVYEEVQPPKDNP
jgi:hypothetical protein